MPKRERIAKPRVRVTKNTRTEVEETKQTRQAEESAALETEMDDLLDEIDSVLESNAQEFVQGFVQRGGQ